MNVNLLEKFIWMTIIALIVLIMIAVLFLKILRFRIRKNDEQSLLYLNESEQLLVDFLYSDKNELNYYDNQQKIIAKFKIGLTKKRNRKTITFIFRKLNKEITGVHINRMYELYEEIGLLSFAKNKLKSKKWNVIAIGIRDLRRFEINKDTELIAEFLNHKREEVRREAHLYFIKKLGFSGLKFLDDLILPISEWDQIQLLSELKDTNDQELPDISRWLKSKNDYVIIFILDIVKMFSRLETKNNLLELLNHPNEKIRVKVIELLGYFHIIEAKQLLKDKFLHLSYKEKAAFLDYLMLNSTHEDSSFVLYYMNNNNFEIKFKALKILKKINPANYNLLEKTSEEKSYNKIINFLDSSYGF